MFGVIVYSRDKIKSLEFGCSDTSSGTSKWTIKHNLTRWLDAEFDDVYDKLDHLYYTKPKAYRIRRIKKRKSEIVNDERKPIDTSMAPLFNCIQTRQMCQQPQSWFEYKLMQDQMALWLQLCQMNQNRCLMDQLNQHQHDQRRSCVNTHPKPKNIREYNKSGIIIYSGWKISSIETIDKTIRRSVCTHSISCYENEFDKAYDKLKKIFKTRRKRKKIIRKKWSKK